MSLKVVGAVMNNDKISVAGGDFGGADADCGHRPIALCELVTSVPIWWLEKARVSLAVSQCGCNAKVKIIENHGKVTENQTDNARANVDSSYLATCKYLNV